VLRVVIAAGGDHYAQHEEPADESVATDGTTFAIALGNEETKKRANIRAAYLHAMRRAKETITIANAYFIPDRGMRRVLANAVARGVVVKVILPGESDVKSVQYASAHMFGKLLKMGVRIFEWPRMLHAKSAVVDGIWTAIGSYNLDARSLMSQLEVVLCVVDRAFGQRMRTELDADCERSKEVHLAEWKKRPLWRKIVEWFFFQFRGWL
jgi:cardiolipin synthase